MFKSYATSLILALFLSGCLEVKDPVVLIEHNTITPSTVPASNILVVYDLTLESPLMVRGLLTPKDRNMLEWRYGDLAKATVKGIQDQGVQADYKLYDSPLPINLPEGYSHLLIEKLVRFTQTTSSRGGSWASNRQWNVTLLEISEPSKPHVIYTQTYMSDAVECFSPRMMENKEPCKAKYVNHILKQLEPVGIKSE